MIRACYQKLPEDVTYPSLSPFDPAEAFPELLKIEPQGVSTSEANHIYASIRTLLQELGLDRENYGTRDWNPFRSLVKPGQQILIKPNLVLHSHIKGPEGVFWIISHPSVIRALTDYALIAVGLSGRVVIGDTPLENCDFGVLCEVSGLRSMVETLKQRGFRNLDLLDFRTYQTIQYPDGSTEMRDLSGDPQAYTEIDLGRSSLFQELEDNQGVQNYYTLGDHTVDHLDPKTRASGQPNVFHCSGKHVYRIPNTILDSDCIISVAKLKTHKFSGVTLCLKNAIGISQGKEYLPHRRPGTPAENGDSFLEYPSQQYVMKLKARRALFSVISGKNVMAIRSFVRRVIPAKLPHEVYSEPLYGDWYGNDTIWRTTLDLNLILFHADRTGFDLERPRRTYLGIIDGIIGMDHEAPMAGLPVDSRLLIAALDPVAADTLGTYLMGFDPNQIPTITGAQAPQCRFLGQAPCDLRAFVGNLPLAKSRCAFVPTKGWIALLA